jgi:hypothetical protein
MMRRLALAGRWTWWTAALVVLGVVLRCHHYLRNPSIWGDEAAVILNALGKSFGELLGPLLYLQAGPPLFFWAEKASGLLLGDNPYVWRLVPFLASCGALCLLVPVARRVLRPEAVPWAVLLLACSDRLLWHSCEAKPYTLDVLTATVVLAVYCGTAAWPLGRRLTVWMLLAPLLIFLSYPGCFLCGGVIAALLPAVRRARRPGAWLGYGLLGLVMAVAFGLLFFGPIHAQQQHATVLKAYWAHHFPRWHQPWTVPPWTLYSTLEVLRYCCEPTGGVLGAVAAVGAVALWRGGRRALVVLLTAPLGLALLAAWVKAYPYGHARLEIFAAPAVGVLIAAGLPPTWAWLRARRGAVALQAVLGTGLLAPAGLALYHAAVPWDRPDSRAAAAYIRAHRREPERVATCQWEFDYYFRDRPDLRLWVQQVPAATDQRLWVVSAEGNGPGNRLRGILQCFPGGWRVIDRREFEASTVVLLARDK